MGIRIFLTFVQLAATIFFSSVEFSPPTHDSGWRFSFAPEARAFFCDYDDPSDGEDDDCNTNYQYNVDKDKNLGDPCPNGCGNPINFATGNKYEEESDYRGTGPFPIPLNRYYNSQDERGGSPYGAKWRGSYTRQIAYTRSYNGEVWRVFADVIRDDGQVLRFFPSGAAWVAAPDVNFTLQGRADGSWSLTTDRDETELYDSTGRLLSITSRGGLQQTVGYDTQGRIAAVTAPLGRLITFSYASDATRLISAIVTPVGNFSYLYDTGGRLVQAGYPDGSSKRYLYENAGFPTHLTGVVDQNGSRFSTFAYDAQGRAISSEHAGGADRFTVSYARYGDGAALVVNPLGANYWYLLTSIHGRAHQQWAEMEDCPLCKYYGMSRHVTRFDANGNVTSVQSGGPYTSSLARKTFTFDLARNLETSRSYTPGSGQTQATNITTVWRPKFRQPAQITAPNRTTAYVYDNRGNVLTKSVTADGQTRSWSYTYNAYNQLKTATDPRGAVTRITYTAEGNIAHVANALGQVTSVASYDANGRPLTIRYPNGLLVTLAYNYRGQITSWTAGRQLTTFTYDAVGRVTGIVWPDGASLTYAYDAAHRLTDISDAVGNHIHYTLDAAGNRMAEDISDPAGAVVKKHARVFDALSRLQRDLGANGQVFEYNYDGYDNLYEIHYPLSGVVRRFFDTVPEEMNRLRQISKEFTFDNGGTAVASIRLEYDVGNRLIGVTDRRRDSPGLVTSFGRNGIDEATSRQNPDSGTTRYTYDAAGNLASSTDGRGQTTVYAYDLLNRLVQKTYGDGSTAVYDYDQGGGANTGRLTQMTDASGVTRWAYDIHGHVLSRQQQIGAIALTFGQTFAPATGKRTSVTYPSGLTLHYGYDANWRVSAIRRYDPATATAVRLIGGIRYQPFGPVAAWAMGNGAHYRRSYDLDGRIASIALPANDNIALSYNIEDRIVGVRETSQPDKAFQYDSFRRISSYSRGAATQFYAYDLADNRTTLYDSAAGTTLSYLYGANYRLTGVTGGAAPESYEFDAGGNTTRHASSAGDYLFAYDARNRLTQASVGAVATDYRVNGLGERTAKTGAAGTTLFVYDEGGRLIGEYDGAGAAIEETVWLGDLPVATIQQGAAYYIAPDWLGAPRQITNGAREPVWFWDHDPFGNGAPKGSLTYNLRFPGQYWDRETGLHYNYFRDYDPKLGRYAQTDPIGFSGGFNAYGYVGGNPLQDADARGLVIDTAWDIANVAADAVSLAENLSAGNAVEAALDGAALAVDAAAAAVPGVPGGAGAALNAYRGSKLARNLDDAGRAVQQGERCHHIVAKNAKKADEARSKLKELELDIDNAVNGVGLPKEVHNSLHTNDYYERVNEVARAWSTKEEAINSLDRLRTQLLDLSN